MSSYLLMASRFDRSIFANPPIPLVGDVPEETAPHENNPGDNEDRGRFDSLSGVDLSRARLYDRSMAAWRVADRREAAVARREAAQAERDEQRRRACDARTAGVVAAAVSEEGRRQRAAERARTAGVPPAPTTLLGQAKAAAAAASAGSGASANVVSAATDDSDDAPPPPRSLLYRSGLFDEAAGVAPLEAAAGTFSFVAPALLSSGEKTTADPFDRVRAEERRVQRRRRAGGSIAALYSAALGTSGAELPLLQAAATTPEPTPIGASGGSAVAAAVPADVRPLVRAGVGQLRAAAVVDAARASRDALTAALAAARGDDRRETAVARAASVLADGERSAMLAEVVALGYSRARAQISGGGQQGSLSPSLSLPRLTTSGAARSSGHATAAAAAAGAPHPIDVYHSRVRGDLVADMAAAAAARTQRAMEVLGL